MFYIVGLGNPGAKYARTRHNIGWLALDACVAAWELPESRLVKKYQSRVSEGMVGGEPVVLAYPETFMNNSGEAVKALVPKGASSQLIVVYDEVDLPVGEFRISFGNSAGGHNGISSIIERLGTKDFVRVRIGVAERGSETGKAVRPAGEDLAAYVLGTFRPEEREVYEKLFPVIVEVIETIMLEGREKAMNKFN